MFNIFIDLMDIFIIE